MWRYLKAAFLARVEVPLLGHLPVNLMGVAAIAVLGLLHPAIWLAGLGIETAYLFLLANSSRFQNVVDAGELGTRRLRPMPEQPPPARTLQVIVEGLQNDDRRLYFELKSKLGKILSLYGQFQVDSYSLESNRASLSALLAHYARLLAARDSIVRHWSADPGELREEIATVEADLEKAGSSQELRASRLQTLEILRIRLLNQEKKESVLAEIASELQRIEQQFDLALENAAIGSRPLAVSADMHLDPESIAAATASAVDADPLQPAGITRRRQRSME